MLKREKRGDWLVDRQEMLVRNISSRTNIWVEVGSKIQFKFCPRPQDTAASALCWPVLPLLWHFCHYLSVLVDLNFFPKVCYLWGAAFTKMIIFVYVISIETLYKIFLHNQAENFKQWKIPELPILCHNWFNLHILLTSETATILLKVIIQKTLSYFAYNFHTHGSLTLCSVVD